jgi:hypothetical protein
VVGDVVPGDAGRKAKTLSSPVGGPRVGQRKRWNGLSIVVPTSASRIVTCLIVLTLIDFTEANGQAIGQSRFGLEREKGSHDPYGNRCIVAAEGFALPVPASPSKLFEHTVSISNKCFKKLRVRVCYRGSQLCKIADLPSNEKTQVVLGYEPSGSFFQFDYKEVPFSYSE